MEYPFIESKDRGFNDLPLTIPSEEMYQSYLIGLHYQTLEYQIYSAQFTQKQTAKLQWFATDIAMA